MSKTGLRRRLGIGTDDPIYPLDVVGDIRLTGGFAMQVVMILIL